MTVQRQSRSSGEETPPRLPGDLADELTLLWVGGLALLLTVLGRRWPGLSGEACEWVQYLALATVFPLLALLLSLRGSAATLAQTARLALAAWCVLAWLAFFVQTGNGYVLFLALFQWGALLVGTRARNRSGGPGSGSRFRNPAGLFVLAAAWSASVYLIYWLPLGEWIFGSGPRLVPAPSEPSLLPFRGRLLDQDYTLLVLLASAILAVAAFLPRGQNALRAPRSLGETIGDIAAVLIFALASWRTDLVGDPETIHHWGVFIGPADMVRQGGWLLWDVPSQYGFLSILAIAALPIQSVWQSLYIAYTTLVLLAAVFLFWVLRMSFRGPLGLGFCFAVTLAAAVLLPGAAHGLTGPQMYPSVSAYRFFWGYALLFVLLWEARGAAGPEGKAPAAGRVFTVGCGIWLLGTLWSVESAVYCAVVWIPAYALMVRRRVRSPRAAAAWLLFPPLLLASALLFLTAFYRLGLGHGPDWQAFTECARTFRAGFAALPVAAFGPVWVLLLAFCAVSAAAVLVFREGGWGHPALSLLVGAAGFLWSASSYFVGRSLPLVVTNLAPHVCTVIAIVLLVFSWRREHSGSAALIRMSFLPVLTLVLTAAYGNVPTLVRAVRGAGYDRNVERRLPVVDPALDSLLRSAGVREDDPVLYYGMLSMPVRRVTDPDGGSGRAAYRARAWLPLTPLALFMLVPEERRPLYAARFASRTRQSGWFIEPKNERHPYLKLTRLEPTRVYALLTRTHTPVKVIEGPTYRLIRFEYNASGRKRAAD